MTFVRLSAFFPHSKFRKYTLIAMSLIYGINFRHMILRIKNVCDVATVGHLEGYTKETRYVMSCRRNILQLFLTILYYLHYNETGMHYSGSQQNALC